MSNLNGFGQKALQNRVAGRNIGERREISQKKSKQINNIPASRPRPTDSFKGTDPRAVDSFSNKNDKYAGDVQRYVRGKTSDNAAYRHARVQRVHDGKKGKSGVSDGQRLNFLEKIIDTPSLHSQNSIRRRFAASAKQAQ